MLQNTAWGLVLSRFSRLGSVGAQQFVRADDEIKGVVGRHDGQRQDDGADAHPATPDPAAEAATAASPVFDVAAFILVIESHASSIA